MYRQYNGKMKKKTRVYTPTTLSSTIHVEQFKQGSQNRLTLTIPEGGEP
jgi:hypothetical protein